MAKRVLGHGIKWDCKVEGCYKELACPDWSFLTGAFPRNCLPTDLDGFVELGNRFLVLEWKFEAADLKRGQQMAFQALTAAGQRSQFLVLVLYGSPYKSNVVYRQWIANGQIGKQVLSTNEDVFELCERWARFATANGL